MAGRPRRHARAPRGAVPSAFRSRDKRVRQKANDEAEARRRDALDLARAEQARLDARIAREAENPVVGRVLGAEWAEHQRQAQEAAERASLPQQRAKPKPKPVLPAPDAQGAGWSLGQARSLLRQGYHIEHVQRLTGWGVNAFDDMKLDTDGYGLPID